jgi:hypothetical protein
MSRSLFDDRSSRRATASAAAASKAARRVARRILPLLVLIAALPCAAQYKVIGADGKVT